MGCGSEEGREAAAQHPPPVAEQAAERPHGFSWVDRLSIDRFTAGRTHIESRCIRLIESHAGRLRSMLESGIDMRASKSDRLGWISPPRMMRIISVASFHLSALYLTNTAFTPTDKRRQQWSRSPRQTQGRSSPPDRRSVFGFGILTLTSDLMHACSPDAPHAPRRHPADHIRLPSRTWHRESPRT